jgi:hypothetical protein
MRQEQAAADVTDVLKVACHDGGGSVAGLHDQILLVGVYGQLVGLRRRPPLVTKAFGCPAISDVSGSLHSCMLTHSSACIIAREAIVGTLLTKPSIDAAH